MLLGGGGGFDSPEELLNEKIDMHSPALHHPDMILSPLEQTDCRKMGFPVQNAFACRKRHLPTEKCTFLQKMPFPAEKCTFLKKNALFGWPQGRKMQQIAGGLLG